MLKLKVSRTILLLTALLLPASLVQAADIIMSGEFSEVQGHTTPCDLVFAELSYPIEFHMLASPRSAVIYFRENPDSDPAFFTRKTLVGSRGYDDLLFKNKLTSEKAPGVSFQVVAKGFYSWDLILLEIDVAAFHDTVITVDPICTTSAKFFARR